MESLNNTGMLEFRAEKGLAQDQARRMVAHAQNPELPEGCSRAFLKAR